jgi:hypothetical protein
MGKGIYSRSSIAFGVCGSSAQARTKRRYVFFLIVVTMLTGVSVSRPNDSWAETPPEQVSHDGEPFEFPYSETTSFFKRWAKLLELREVAPGGAAAFCERFLTDLADMRGITLVRPIVSAKALDDPALAPFANSCPNISINKVVTNDTIPEEDQDKAGVAFYSSANFYVYFTNIVSTDPRSEKKQYVVYGGDRHCLASNPNRCGGPNYTAIDFTNCTSRIISGGPDPYDEAYEEDDHKKKGYNGIIEYRGRIWFLSGGFFGKGKNGDINSFFLNRAYPEQEVEFGMPQPNRPSVEKIRPNACYYVPKVVTPDLPGKVQQ